MSSLDVFAEHLIELAPHATGPEPTEHAKLALAHNLLVALAARAVRVPGEWGSLGTLEHRESHARRLRDGRYVPTQEAIMSNSLMMGARAQHDEHPSSVSHFGSAVIPALLAAADSGMISGSNGNTGAVFLQSMVLGYQAGAALAGPARPLTTPKGFRPTGLYGPIAAATAVAYSSGATPTELRNACAFALSTSAGLTQVWRDGSDEWRFQTAHAARSGFEAAHFAIHGGIGAPHALEGASGFLHAFANLDEDGSIVASQRVLNNLRQLPWAITEMLLKPYPVCAINQAAVVGAINLVQQHQLSASEIAHVTVTLSASDAAYPGVDHAHIPTTWAQAMMSLQHAIATVLVHGSISYSDLLPPFCAEIEPMLDRIRVVPNDRVGHQHNAHVSITLLTGEQHESEESITVPKGWDEIEALSERLLPEINVPGAEIMDLINAVASLDANGGYARFRELLNRLTTAQAA